MDHESADRKAQNQQQRTSHTIALPKATVLVNKASPKFALDAITPCITYGRRTDIPARLPSPHGASTHHAKAFRTPFATLPGGSFSLRNPASSWRKKTARSAKLLAGTMFSMKAGLRGSNLLSTCARSLRSGAWLPPRSCRRVPEPRPDGLSSTRGNGPHR